MRLSELTETNELCPNCGNFVDYLNELTGFCVSCSSGVGVFDEKAPTPNAKNKRAQRLELWLTENADIIEDIMLAENKTAKEAIKLIVQDGKPTCQCCGDEMPHTTAGRHMICTKRPECRKARRYYRYLVYEKNVNKEVALDKTLERFAI